MTDTVAQPGTVALEPASTVLNPQTVTNAAGNGTPNISEGKEDTSPAAVMEAELARLKAEDADAEKATKEKADAAAKDAKAKADDAEKAEDSKKSDDGKGDEKAKAPQRGDDGKFAKAAGEKQPDAKVEEGAAEKPATERAGQDDRQSEGRKHSEPPARFLPEARVKWANVPNEVKAEVHRVSQEYEAEIARSKPAVERYEQLRQFDETARSNGRDLRDSLNRVVQVEQALARNSIAGLNAVLREIGPRKADGSPVTLMEVAQHIVQNPQAYEQAMRPQMVQQPASQSDPKVAALEKQLGELQSMLTQQQVQPLIDRFAASHSDYHALEPQIAAVLKSGVIEQLHGPGLSPEQRLEQAYRMAGGSPSSQSTPAADPAHSEAKTDRPVNPDAGNKSVRGAPSDGSDPPADETETDLREVLRKELRKIA